MPAAAACWAGDLVPGQQQIVHYFTQQFCMHSRLILHTSKHGGLIHQCPDNHLGTALATGGILSGYPYQVVYQYAVPVSVRPPQGR